MTEETPNQTTHNNENIINNLPIIEVESITQSCDFITDKKVIRIAGYNLEECFHYYCKVKKIETKVNFKVDKKNEK